jgi:TolA-binding protein
MRMLVALTMAVVALVACGGAEAQNVAPTPVVSTDEIRKLRNDVTDLQDGIESLEAEIQSVKGSIGEVREEITDLHATRWEFESSYWGIYEQAVGLTPGRGNRYKQWLREQGFPTYAAFIFEVMLLGNYPEITVESFLDYIAASGGKSTRANGDALAAFGALSTKEQRSFLAALPVDTEEQRQRFEQELLHGGLRERYNPLAADGRASSAYRGEKRRAFELSPDAQEMTFLEHLRRENELR